MGTLSVSIKSAALCGALLVPLSAAHAQDIGASAGVGSGAGLAGAPGATVGNGTAATASPRSTNGAVRSPTPGLSTTTQATTTQAMPGLMQNGGGANLALSGPGTAPSAGTSGGLTPSDQTLLMNFGSAPAPAGASNVPTPAQQMHAQIQAEQQSAITSNGAVGPVQQTVPGSTIGTAASASPNTGGLNSTVSGGLTPSPVVSPPVATNPRTLNPGTLAETAQSAAQ